LFLILTELLFLLQGEKLLSTVSKKTIPRPELNSARMMRPPVWACLLTDPHVGQSSARLPLTDVLATDGRVGQLEAELWCLASGINNLLIG